MNEVRTGEGAGSSWNLFSEWLNLLPFPNLCRGRREQMDTGRRGRRVRNEGDGWGTDGVRRKWRGESARMAEKFSTWPWVEMKICMQHWAARFLGCILFSPHGTFPVRSRGPFQQLSASQGTCTARTWIFSRGHLLQKDTCTVFKACSGNGRGELCANTGTEMGWDVIIHPGIPAKPEIGVYISEELYYTQFVRIQWPKYSE